MNELDVPTCRLPLGEIPMQPFVCGFGCAAFDMSMSRDNKLVDLDLKTTPPVAPGPPPFQHCKTLSPTLNWRTLAPLFTSPLGSQGGDDRSRGSHRVRTLPSIFR